MRRSTPTKLTYIVANGKQIVTGTARGEGKKLVIM